MNNLMQKLTIQVVSERLQLPKSTIRFWEKEFSDFITPERTSGGQRRYSIKDMAVIEAIRDLKQSGLSLAQIKARLTSNAQVDQRLDPSLADQLADSIAGMVRREIYNLLRQGK